MDIVEAISAQTPGIRTNFSDAYGVAWKDVLSKYGQIMELAVPSDGAYEIYHRFESAPHPKRWPRGTPRNGKGFKGKQYTVYNHDWQVGVRAHENDVMDDRTGRLVARAQDSGKNGARVPVRVFQQIEGSATNVDLLPSSPNCPDGATLFSATDGASANRFGVSGGNIISGTGVASVAAIQNDIASAIVRAQAFTDTEGQPFYGDSVEEEGYTIVASYQNMFVFKKAIEQMRPLVVVQNVAGTENVAAAATSNALQDTGLKPAQLILSPYKTGNDWSLWLHAAPVKAIFQQTRQAMQYTQINRHNNGWCFDNKMAGWDWDWREGYGTNDPIGAIMVDN